MKFLVLLLLPVVAWAGLVTQSGSRLYVQAEDPDPDPGEILFSEDFQTPGPDQEYGFAYRYDVSDLYSYSHNATGGPDGGPANDVSVDAEATQISGPGWIATLGEHSFSVGDEVYVRFRIRFSDATRLLPTVGAIGMKFVTFGTTPSSSNRVILRFNSVSGSANTWELNDSTHPPSEFGLSGTWNDGTNNGKYISWDLALNINGEEDRTGPVCMSYGNNPSPCTPGPYSAAAVNGWNHVQIRAKSGSAGNAILSVWVNNNTFATPTRTKTLESAMGVNGWDEGVGFGVVIDGSGPAQDDWGFRITDAEVGTGFDPGWAPT